MRIWRLRKSRSLNRQVDAELRRAWIGPSWGRVRARLTFVYARSPYLLPQVVLAGILLLPAFIAGIGTSPPSWLEGAWQVTGVLIGLALVVFIFLLESTTDRSLRSVVTFRAVIQRSAIEWPLGFGLTFIGYAILALKLSGAENSRAIPGWAESIIVGVFLAQIVLIGISFARGIELARPGSVANAMRRVFRTEVFRTVEITLRDQASAEIVDRACQAASKEAGRKDAVRPSIFFSRGTPLFSQGVGQVKDFDLKLPSKITQSMHKGELAFAVSLGESVSKGSTIAWLANESWSEDLRELVNRGIAIGKSRGSSQAQVAFNEALDFAAREATSRESADLDLTLEVVPSMFLDVHKIWLSFGDPGSHHSPGGFFPRSLEEEMGHRLWTICGQFLTTGRKDLVEGISSLASNLIATGRQENAALVAEQGFDLCAWQCHNLILVKVDEVRDSVPDRVMSVLSGHQRVLRYILEDGHGEARDQADSRDLLLSLNRTTVRSLKALTDVGYLEPFPRWLKELGKGRVYSSLRSEVESLELRVMSEDPDPRLLESLESHQNRLCLVEEVDQDLAAGIFELGAWIAKEASNDADPAERWGACLRPLCEFVDYELLQRLLTGQEGVQSFPYLRSWYMDEQTSRGVSTWSGDGSGFGFRWAAILLVSKRPTVGEQTNLLSELDEGSRSGLLVQVESVASERDKWGFLFQAHAVDEFIAEFKAAAAAVSDLKKREDLDRIARAELSPAIVERVAEANAESFMKGQVLTKDLEVAGRIQTKGASRATPQNTLVVETFLPKEFFVEDGVFFDEDQFGNTLARERDRRYFASLIEHGPDAKEMSLDRFVDVVSRIEGGSNRVIYASDNRLNRNLMFRHPTYEPDRSNQKFGTLGGVDVFMVPTDQTYSEVVAVDRRMIGLIQYTDTPGRAIELEVSALDKALARKLLSRGRPPHEVDEDDVIDAVHSKVFVSATTSFEPNLSGLPEECAVVNLLEATEEGRPRLGA